MEEEIRAEKRGRLGRGEHWSAGPPEVWGELLEMLIPLVLFLSFLLCISPYNISFFHKKSLSLSTPEPVFVILVHGGRSRFCGAQSIQSEELSLRKTALEGACANKVS